MRLILILGLALPLAAQVPDAALFKQDLQTLMVAAAEKAAALKPKHPMIQAQVGRAHLLAGNETRAQESFRWVGAGGGEAILMAGRAWLEVGKLAEAREWLDPIPTRWPKHKSILLDAAIQWMDHGESASAEACMARAFALDQEDWQNVTAYGRACLRKGRQDLAAPWFAKAAQEERKEAGLWNEIALALANGGVER